MHLVDRNNSNGFDREEPRIKNFESAAFHPSEDRKQGGGKKRGTNDPRRAISVGCRYSYKGELVGRERLHRD